MRKRVSPVSFIPEKLRRLAGVTACFLAVAALGSAAAAEGPGSGQSMLWLKNVRDQPASVRVENGSDRTQLELRAGEWVGLKVADTAQVRWPANAQVLMLRAPTGIDARAMELELHPAAQIERLPQGARITFERPDWVLEVLSALAIEGATLHAGQKASAPLTLAEVSKGGGRVDAALAFKGPGSVRLRLVDAGGRPATTVVATAPQALRWRIPLGDLTAQALAGGMRLEIVVLRGEVVTTVGLTPTGSQRRVGRPVVARNKVGGGGAYYNYAINWDGTPDLYYYVYGAPASTCGDIHTYRNGSWLVSANWVCTDAYGNATKGPWSWAGTASDQTDSPTYIEWPGGSTTSASNHVWDKSCPTASFNPAPSGAPPTTWQGDATDVQWGACFHAAWSEVASSFYDYSTGKYWNQSSGTYSAIPGSGAVVYGTLSGSPSCSVGWGTAFPPPTAHVAGHHYYWTTCVSDGGCGSCVNYDFIY